MWIIYSVILGQSSFSGGRKGIYDYLLIPVDFTVQCSACITSKMSTLRAL